ncbi:MAG: beta-1,4-galactosyltransferase [Deltaproteobacteria bacterium]|nr:beta-1,4-galactosyltransferase [Deltaproteobacteria bacterium]
MIFVTVGNHYQGFDRLIKKADEIASLASYDILIQKGYSPYFPKSARYFDFVPIQTAMQYIQSSELVISHAGIGTIILCKEYGIPLIIFPRRKIYGEHGTDHQVEIARAIEERKDDHIFIVYEEDQLEAKIAEVLAKREKPVPGTNVGRANLIRTIRAFIEDQN